MRDDGQRVLKGERMVNLISTFTALIQSDRSWVESALHSRRTFGFLQVLLDPAAAVETRRERSRTRATARKEEAICEEGGVVRKERRAAHTFYKMRCEGAPVSATRAQQGLSPN